jgi:hypothetical protein
MMQGAYRALPVTDKRCRETAERLRSAFGSVREPLLEAMLSDMSMFNQAVPLFMKEIALIVTSWYAPFLVQEIREARHYEDAISAASLLAFSEKDRCIESLGGLLRSSRPLDVLVSSEALGDLVAYASTFRARRLALSFLMSSGSEVAHLELEKAREQAPHRGGEENAWNAAVFPGRFDFPL